MDVVEKDTDEQIYKAHKKYNFYSLWIYVVLVIS